jgi:hypothetical protein
MPVYIRDRQGVFAWVVPHYESGRDTGTFKLIEPCGDFEKGFPEPGSFIEKDLGRLLRRHRASPFKRCALRSGEFLEDHIPASSKLLLKWTHPYTVYQPSGKRAS